MTNQNCNKFLTLLMGECWHKWEKSGYEYHCSKCGIYGQNKFYPEPMNDPLPVISFMEKEMTEVWEEYLCWVEHRFTGTLTEELDYNLDLRNLVTYLIEHPEWGEKECPQVNCMSSECKENPECGGTGRIIHPALKYLREVQG